MRISTLRKVIKQKTVANDYIRMKVANIRKSNYDEYVKISDDLSAEAKDYLQGVKSTLGNFLKKGNYEVTFKPVYKEPQKISMNLYLKEHPILRMIYDFWGMVHDKPVKLNKEEIFININPKAKDEAVSPARKIFNAILDVFQTYDELLNNNLKKN